MQPAPRPVETPRHPLDVVVNGTAQTVRARMLDGLLAELGYDSPFIGTAVNGELVRRAERAGHTIEAGDRIEILSPMQGG